MPRLPLFLTLAALAGTACQRPGQVSRQTVSQSLKGVLVYPRSVVVTMASGDSVGQLTLASQDPPDSVASWFRTSLAVNRWTLQGDSRQPDGSILIYAERASRPLWINLQRASGGSGTTYSVTGAVTGSAEGAAGDSTQRSGSSRSSKRIQRR